MSGTPDLPAGVVTFVFTDIEGSTRLLRTLGDDYAAVLDLHRAILRDAWSAHAGHVVGTEGDAFFVVFARASDALEATVDAQRGLEQAGWPEGTRLRVRIGVHAGYAQPRAGDYTALAVHQAARVVSAAHGGQVLLSGDAVDRLDAVSEGVAVERLGRFRVRDFDDPVELFGVRAPGMTAVDRQPRVRPEDGHNLVRPTTTLLGRDEDLARITGLIAPGRVTTIVGPGGVGKTRLAVEAALGIAGQWADGAWLVDLAPVAEPNLLPEAIAETVGAAVPGADPWTEVCEHLREREALIILDNCERLSEAAALRAARLIEGCPGVGVLATGRQPLGLRGEDVHRLEPLTGAPAAQLFLDRATAGAGDDPEAVRDLCDELDGLPLAIELAAARTTAMAPSEILARLRESPSSVLRSRDPALPERQRTLEQLIDWSYDLLEPREQTALGRLSVFADGFGLTLALRACASDDLPGDVVPELVWSLVDASLVVCDAAAGATRYRLPATVRAHVSQRAGAAERAQALDRITRAFLELLGPARSTRPNGSGA